jgi:amino acid transporter
MPARLEDVKRYGNASEAQVAMFDRNHPRYPYKSHGQWFKAAYGGVACTILVLFNGFGTFLQRPFDRQGFVASYVGVSRTVFSLSAHQPLQQQHLTHS